MTIIANPYLMQCMRILAKIALALTLFETRTAFSYQGTSQDTSKIFSHIYRGASLWNFVNCNDKEASLTQNFNVCMYVCMYVCINVSTPHHCSCLLFHQGYLYREK